MKIWLIVGTVTEDGELLSEEEEWDDTTDEENFIPKNLFDADH